ncbi:MAG: hypothetical protein OXG02_04825 [Chloroflexi bacterium]|nr:hypothetical protein [Chloroflexota bacterium]
MRSKGFWWQRWLWLGLLAGLLLLPASGAAAQERPPSAAASESDRARLRAVLARLPEVETWRVDFAFLLRRAHDRTRAAAKGATLLKASGHFRHGGRAEGSFAARLVFPLAEPGVPGPDPPLAAAIALSWAGEELHISLAAGGRQILERVAPLPQHLAGLDRFAESGIADVWRNAWLETSAAATGAVAGTEALAEFAAVLASLLQEHSELWRAPESDGSAAWQATLDGRQVLLDPRFTAALVELISAGFEGRAPLPFAIGPLELSIALGLLYTWIEEAHWEAEFVLPAGRATEREELLAATLATRLGIQVSLPGIAGVDGSSLQLLGALHWRNEGQPLLESGRLSKQPLVDRPLVDRPLVDSEERDP